jgi:hypothetical protein
MNPSGYAQVLEEGVDAGGGGADGKLDAAEVGRSFTLGMQVLAQGGNGDIVNCSCPSTDSAVACGHASEAQEMRAKEAKINGVPFYPFIPLLFRLFQCFC